MNLTIEHETRYVFDEPAEHSIQCLRLTPRADPCQRVHSWHLDVRGVLWPWTDGFDNIVHMCVRDELHEEIVVTVTGQVQTFDTSGVLTGSDGLSPLIFLRETPFTRIDESIRTLAVPFVEQKENGETLSVLHAVMRAIADAVEYRPGQTHVETDAAAALEQGQGVCQDHAHLFIACCRVLGVPARYVSGYLYAGPGDVQLASHAWAEAHVDNLGWVSFDPSNRQSATDAYVRLAIGFDYSSAGPLRGLRRGGGTEMLNVRVQVGQIQE